jgi:S-adenosylmethionine-diacylglycerol 3-amino-3-carboxypropyl transferase
MKNGETEMKTMALQQELPKIAPEATQDGQQERIENRAAFDLVRYANCWEDADILCTALKPEPGKRMLSIASAGDNALALLAGGAEVVAADLNPVQLACVELRCAAFKNFDHDGVLAFLGVCPCNERLALYQDLRTDLSPAARRYWDSRPETIRGGFIHAGKFENYFRLFRTRVLPLIHSRKVIEELLLEKDADARLAFHERRWNTLRWRLLFRVFFGRFVMGRAGRDPEFFRYVEGSVADRLLSWTRHGLTALSTHDNPYITYILTGNYGEALPRYLRPENYEGVRSGLDRLTLFQGPIEEAAKRHGEGGFDGYNLSDVFEYLSPELSRELFETFLDHARPKARLAYWNMLVPRRCPFSDRVTLLDEESRELRAQDKAFFYHTFNVDEVH